MKALTFDQPLADMVADGRVWAISRSHQTDHRGPVLIHQAGSPVFRGLAPHAFIAVAELTLCVSWDLVKRQALRTDRVAECCPGCHRTWGEIRNEPHHPDMPHVWVLENVIRLETPIPSPGHSGLWEAPELLLNKAG